MIIANFLADVIYSFLDPRITLGGALKLENRQKEITRLRKLIFTNGLSGFGFVTVLVFLLLAFLYWATGGRTAPYPANAINLSSPNLPPSLVHFFGTDFEEEISSRESSLHCRLT